MPILDIILLSGLTRAGHSPYLSWCFRDETGYYGPLKTLTTPCLDALGQWDPHAADGEIASPDAMFEEDFDPRPIIYEVNMDSDPKEEEPMEWESDPELKPMELEPEPRTIRRRSRGGRVQARVYGLRVRVIR
ncbi:hypothetical protein NL676_030475 [Syzygium grande]|nr:hypothetical protein NL676_030475 [Syzygium grande]